MKNRYRFAAIAAMAVLAVGCVVAPVSAERAGPDAAYPNFDKTPGVPSATKTVADVCPVSGPTPRLSQAQRHEVFVRDGIAPADEHDYEVVRIIPPSLAGDPFADGNLRTMRKDAAPNHARMLPLIVHLHHEVCAGRLRIEQAQAIFMRDGDWVAERVNMRVATRLFKKD